MSRSRVEHLQSGSGLYNNDLQCSNAGKYKQMVNFRVYNGRKCDLCPHRSLGASYSGAVSKDGSSSRQSTGWGRGGQDLRALVRAGVWGGHLLTIWPGGTGTGKSNRGIFAFRLVGFPANIYL